LLAACAFLIMAKGRRQNKNRLNRRRRAGGQRFYQRGPGARKMGDAAALRGIKQGVGRSVAKPFGSGTLNRYHPCMHDAFHHAHLPLPRAVGPYTVVRTTQVVTSAQQLVIIGPLYNKTADRWCDLAGFGFTDGNKTVGDANNTVLFPFGSLRNNSAWGAAQATPSACSLQLMNPNALQTTAGIVYIGRMRTVLRPSEDLSDKVNVLANRLVSYNNPRLCSAAKLAFRGVQIDLVPYNMNSLSNFTLQSADTFTQYGASSPDPNGFAPAFIYNPSGLNLQLLVCFEWRVRFDPSNPAQATHVHHPPASEGMWAQAQHVAESIGNGVVDIADKVAETGNAVVNAMGSMYGVARGVRALRGVAPALALM